MINGFCCVNVRIKCPMNINYLIQSLHSTIKKLPITSQTQISVLKGTVFLLRSSLGNLLILLWSVCTQFILFSLYYTDLVCYYTEKTECKKQANLEMPPNFHLMLQKIFSLIRKGDEDAS